METKAKRFTGQVAPKATTNVGPANYDTLNSENLSLNVSDH